STADLPSKLANLASTLSGKSMFGFLTRIGAEERPRAPKTALDKVSTLVSDIAGHPKAGFMGYALMIAILLMPALWATPARRPMLFSTIAVLVAWLQMLFTHGVGSAAHHVVL